MDSRRADVGGGGSCLAYAKLIKDARHRLKISQEELARRVGVTKGAISQWEAGISAPSRNNSRRLAIALGISQLELEAVLSSGLSLLDNLPQGREIPFLAWDRLGQLNGKKKRSSSTDGLSGGIVIVDGDTPADAVAASVDDESMEPEFHPGDIIIFSASVTPRQNDTVVAAVGDGHVLRRYKPRGKNKAGEEVFDLVSASPDFDTIGSSAAQIIGVVIEHRRKRR
jgi:transcriptional regulator with XRE-family HTH domain